MRTTDRMISFIDVYISKEDVENLLIAAAKKDCASYAIEPGGHVFIKTDAYGGYVVSIQKKGS